MKISKFTILQVIFYALSGMNIVTMCQQSNSPKEKMFFNKKVKSCEQNIKNFKEKLESKITNIIDGKTNHPKIIKNCISNHSQNIKEVLLWFNETYNGKDACKDKDEMQALEELANDVDRISKENELPSSYSQTVGLCQQNIYGQTPTCENLILAYDSFRFHTQGIPEIRKVKSLDHQIEVNFDDKYTITFLEKAKKRLHEDLEKINKPLFDLLKNSNPQQVLDNNSSYFESLSEKDQKTLTNIIENAVYANITNFDNLAEEFQKLFYVFHEKAARKHLNEKEVLEELLEDVKRTRRQKGSYNTYSGTVYLCALARSDNQTSECKRLAQAYKQLRSRSSMYEIKKINSLQNQINAQSSLSNSNNDPVIAFLKEEKEQLEQEVKKNNNGKIPTNIPSYYDSLDEKNKKELINVITNVVKKQEKLENFGEEFQKIFEVFDEKL